MAEEHIPSKVELLDALRTSEQAVESLSTLPAEAFEQGRYESGWTAREILAHVASIEWTYPKLMDIAKQGTPIAEGEKAPPVRRTEPHEAGGAPTRTMQGGIDGYNQRQVDKRAQASVEELLAEFQKNRAATVAAVEEAGEALLITPIRSAGGITGALASVIRAVAVEHVLAHVNDIAGTEHPGRRW